MDALKITHIIMPLTLAFLYIYFILFLVKHLLLRIIFSGFRFSWLASSSFCSFCTAYLYTRCSIRALGMRLTRTRKTKWMWRKLGTTRKMENVCMSYFWKWGKISLMSNSKKCSSNLFNYNREYLRRYQQESFCETCQIIKSPRTYHCPKCGKCIQRREKHSDLINMCVGTRNMKIFMQHLFISMVNSHFI